MKINNLDNFPTLKRGEIVMSIAGSGEKITLLRATSPPGTILPEHSHHYEQIGFLAEGRLKLTSGGKTFDLGPGSSWTINANEPHEFLVVGDKSILAFEAFSPPREDYIAMAQKK